MNEKKKAARLTEEELDKVTGGWVPGYSGPSPAVRQMTEAEIKSVKEGISAILQELGYPVVSGK